MPRLRHRPARSGAFPWGRTVRGALVLTTALLAATDASSPAVASLLVAGAVCSVNGDHSGPFRERLERLAGVLLGGSAGLALGCVAAGSGAGQIAVMAVAGLVAGLLGCAGAAGGLAGLKLMALTAIGIGLGGALPVHRAVGCYLAGCLPMIVLLLATARRRPRPAPGTALHRPQWRPALRLSLCVALAAAVGVLLHSGHAFWLPLTAALVFRPAEASVLPRVTHRALGTALGVLAAAALTHLPATWGLPTLALLLGAALPGATDRAYLWHSALVSVIVLVLATPGTSPGHVLIGTRLLDTLLACALVLAFTRWLWPER